MGGDHRRSGHAEGRREPSKRQNAPKRAGRRDGCILRRAETAKSEYRVTVLSNNTIAFSIF
jgi:hypothetical protein